MIQSIVKRILLWCGLQEYVDDLKQQLKDEQSRTRQVAETLHVTLEMRDAWRDTAIQYCRERESWKKRYETAAEKASTLIRFDFVKKQYNMDRVESTPTGEFVKYRALSEVFHD